MGSSPVAVSLSHNDPWQVVHTHTHTHISASVTKQYNFVLGKQRRCTVVGKITAGLVYGNGSLLLGLWYGIVEFNVQLDTL